MSELPPIRTSGKLILPPIKSIKTKLEETNEQSSENVKQETIEQRDNSNFQQRTELKRDISESDYKEKTNIRSHHNMHIKPPLLQVEGSYFEEADIHETIPLILTLPSGEIITKTIKIGDTVQAIKRTLLIEYSLPYDKIELCLEGKTMMDPLSLNDFPLIVERKVANLVAQGNNVQKPIQMISYLEESPKVPEMINIPPNQENEAKSVDQNKMEEESEEEERELSELKEGWIKSTKEEEQPKEVPTINEKKEQSKQSKQTKCCKIV